MKKRVPVQKDYVGSASLVPQAHTNTRTLTSTPARSSSLSLSRIHSHICIHMHHTCVRPGC